MFSKKSDRQFIRIIIASTVFGLLAALVGTFFINSLSLIKSYDIESQNQEFLKTSLGIKAFKKLEVFEFLDKALPATAEFYKRKYSPSQTIDKIYLKKDRVGFGFVLTSDGWIATTKSIPNNWDASRLVVAVGGKTYKIEKVIYDGWTDAAFLKINASNLPVVSLGESKEMGLGDVVFTGAGKNNFQFSYINAINFYPDEISKTDLVLSSEEFGKIITLQDNFSKDLNGAMVSNYRGEVIGMVVAKKSESLILPIDYFKEIIPDVLKNQKIRRPYLGINYIDLNFALGEELPYGHGAYVYGGGFVRSVLQDSPAQRVGLKSGDVILKVDEENINDYKNLAEIISEYDIGDEIGLRILREGKEIDIPIILEED